MGNLTTRFRSPSAWSYGAGRHWPRSGVLGTKIEIVIGKPWFDGIIMKVSKILMNSNYVVRLILVTYTQSLWNLISISIWDGFPYTVCQSQRTSSLREG